jgi:hypothetical protein
MDEDELKRWALIGLIFLVGFGIVPVFIFEWFLKNVFTPIGTFEDIAWALSSPNPWDWVWRLMLLAIVGLIFAGIVAWAKKRIEL